MEKMAEKQSCDIGVALVTYNRLEKLKKALASYEAQTVSPAYLIVVDNASGDGTSEFLDNWKEELAGFPKYVLHLPENVGSSGGFYIGQKKALSLEAKWVMVADDDAYLEPDYLEGMWNYIHTHDETKLSIVCGKVLQQGEFTNGHRGHFPKRWLVSFHKNLTKRDYENASVDIDVISYVGIVISVAKMKEVGLAEPKYFIWCDDVEQGLRLATVGRIVCLPKYTVIHDCDEEDMTLSWKTYYGWRNQIDMCRRHFPVQFILGTAFLFCKTCLLPLKGNRWTEMCLRFTAIWNGVRGKLGLHEKYRPGWKP